MLKEGRINADGVLEIKRAGKFKPQECRSSGLWTNNIGDFPEVLFCGDDCSLFDEPEPGKNGKGAYLQLCKRLLAFEEFEDQR